MKKKLNDILDEMAPEELDQLSTELNSEHLPNEVVSSIKEKVYAKTNIVNTAKIKSENRTPMGVWIRMGALVACFALIIGAIALLPTLREDDPSDVINTDERAVLCGEEGCSHIFTSRTQAPQGECFNLVRADLPTAVVEVLDPMVLSSKVRDVCECNCETAAVQIPPCIREMFDEDLVISGDRRRMFVTLGQFSIIRLERDAQLVVPVLDYSIPTKECCESPDCAEDPCELFSRIPFPTARFTPKGCDKAEACAYTTTN